MESFKTEKVISYDLDEKNEAKVLLNESGIEYHVFLEEELKQFPENKKNLQKIPKTFFKLLKTLNRELEKLDTTQ